MDIPKATYTKLTPQQRTSACISALLRQDVGEMDRLLSSAPREGGHGKAWLLASQAITAYTILVLEAQRNMALSMIRLHDLTDELRNDSPLKVLNVIGEKIADETTVFNALYRQLAAIETIAAEWCAKNHVNPDDFGNVHQLPPPKAWPRGECDAEVLEAAGRVFTANG